MDILIRYARKANSNADSWMKMKIMMKSNTCTGILPGIQFFQVLHLHVVGIKLKYRTNSMYWDR